MYAQFSDAPDAPGPDDAPISEGNVQFGKDRTSEQKPPTPAPPQPTTSTVPKLAIFGGFVLVIVIAFTLANFIMLMEIRSGRYLDTNVQNVILNMNNTLMAHIRGQCRISYMGKCFWAIRRGKMEFIDGLRSCRAHDAVPANIYSKQHFDMVGAYLKHTRPDHGDSVWLGMTRNQSTGKSYLRDKIEVNFEMRWFVEGYPKSDESHEQLAMHYDEDAMFNGFMNEEPTAAMRGVLCEI